MSNDVVAVSVYVPSSLACVAVARTRRASPSEIVSFAAIRSQVLLITSVPSTVLCSHSLLITLPMDHTAHAVHIATVLHIE